MLIGPEDGDGLFFDLKAEHAGLANRPS